MKPGPAVLAFLVVASVTVPVAAQDARPTPWSPTVEARVLYLQGSHVYGTFGPGATARAEEFARRAIKADSTFAKGWSLLAMSTTGETAKTAALRSIKLDSSRGEAWTALGRVQFAERDFAAAERSYRRAIAVEPGYTLPHYFLGLAFTALGRYQEGLTETEKTFQADPFRMGDSSVQPLLALGRYDDLIALCRGGLAVDSNQTENVYYAFLGFALVEKGQYPEALQAFARQRIVRGLAPTAYAWALARAGKTAEAQAVLKELTTVPNPTQAQQLGAASLYANLKQADSAFVWLEKAFPRGGMTDLRWHTQWAPIRSDPRFQALVRRVGLSS